MNGSHDALENSQRPECRSFDSAGETGSEEYRIDVGGSDSDQSSVYYGAIHRPSDESFDGDVSDDPFRGAIHRSSDVALIDGQSGSKRHCNKLLHYCCNFILIIRCVVCCCPATLFSVFCGCCIEGLCTVKDTVSYCCQPFISPPYYISRF